MIREILDEAKGTKVVCGGTASNIVSREYDEKIDIDLDTMSERVPPVGRMKSIDLVTEGVLTIQETVNIIEDYIHKRRGHEVFEGNNGASILADLLVNHCTHLDLILGNSINPAHQNPDLPITRISPMRSAQSGRSPSALSICSRSSTNPSILCTCKQPACGPACLSCT